MNRESVEIHGRIWLTLAGKPLLGKGRIELLCGIEATGSISKAAKAMKMSYKSAWDSVDAMNNALGTPVVESATGGVKGGGSQLTAAGKRLIAEFQAIEKKHKAWLVNATTGLNKILAAK